MTPDMVIDIMRSALYVAMTMVVVIVLPSLVVGLIVAMFQAATQINEQTMSFLPRLVITLMALGMAGPWLSRMVGEFARGLINDIPFLIG